VVAGYDVVREPDKVRANVGFLAASTALYARLTAREMIEYFGRLNGLDDAMLRKRIQSLADELDMHEFLDRRCDKLSTGMKQKTSIARTLVHDPQVMIFDEPTLGLDVMAARAIVRFVRECRTRGKTVIYSTHVMSEAEKLCDVIGVIHGGALLAEGTLAELRARTGETDLEECFVKIVAPEHAR
jgi:sodium transport system ATP-binding protein